MTPDPDAPDETERRRRYSVCCEAGFRAAPGPCPWHDAETGQLPPLHAELAALRAENEQLRRDAADQLSRDGQEMRLDERPPPPPLPRDVCFTYEGFQELCGRHIAQRDRSDRLSAGLRKMARRSTENRRNFVQSSRRYHNVVASVEFYMAENKQLRAESAHRRDALHHAWAERDRLRSELAELKAGRAAGATPIGEGRLSLTYLPSGKIQSEYQRWDGSRWLPESMLRNVDDAFIPCPDEAPADRGPLTPHPPPWPIDDVLTPPKPGENFDIPCARCGFDRHHHTVDDGARQDFEEGDEHA